MNCWNFERYTSVSPSVFIKYPPVNITSPKIIKIKDK